jgi:hypothetical protein
MSQARGFAGGDVLPELFAIAATICVLQGSAPVCFKVSFVNEPSMNFIQCSEKLHDYTSNIFGRDGFGRVRLTSYQVWCYPVTMG